MDAQAALFRVAAEKKTWQEKLDALEAKIEEAQAAHDKDEVAALRAEKFQLLSIVGRLHETETELVKRLPGALLWR